MADELHERIRHLEAERMRPVPEPARWRPTATTATTAEEHLRVCQIVYFDDHADAQQRLEQLAACIDDDQLDEYHYGGRG